MPHQSQTPIKAENVPLYCVQPPEPKSTISRARCKGNCPCGKTTKPPIVVPLLNWPRDSNTLSIGHIYQAVQIFPLLYCEAIVWDTIRLENVTVLRKGEYFYKQWTHAAIMVATLPKPQHMYTQNNEKLIQ